MSEFHQQATLETANASSEVIDCAGELELAIAIQHGDIAEDELVELNASDEYIEVLKMQIAKRNEAQRMLIDAHIEKAMSFASLHMRDRQGSVVETSDCTQTACLGLLRAAHQFSPWMVKNHITFEEYTYRQIYIEIKQLHQDTDTVSFDELRFKAAPEEEDGLETGFLKVEELIPDDAMGADGVIDRTALAEKMGLVLKTLSKYDGEVVKLNYGIDADRRYTHEEIGAMYDVYPSTIKPRVHRSVVKLRNRFIKAHIVDFYHTDPEFTSSYWRDDTIISPRLVETRGDTFDEN